MTAPAKRPRSRVVPTLLVLVALALILNPELRALFFLTNVIGFEIIGILLALQLRSLIDLVPEVLRPAAFACNLASRLGYLALVAYSGAVSFRVFDRLFCPVLITISYGLGCQPSDNRWRGP